MISLGAGVQSTALLLMAARGEFDPSPKLAIFADTGGEPRAVYEHLAWLEAEVTGRIEVVRTTQGDLRADLLAHARGERKRVSNPPVFTTSAEGGAGMIRRSCTRDYKIRPFRAELRRRGYGPKAPVTSWQGITVDEAQRMKRANPKDWQDFAYPLIDLGMSRHDCELWLRDYGVPHRVPKSACTFCPFHTDAVWRDLRDNSPTEWAEAVALDVQIRHLPSLESDVFLHRSRLPLAEVDLRTPEDLGQAAFDFGDECEGVCGL